MSNFTIFHNVFYAICILKSFNSRISVVVCSFFEFGTVSKWYIREMVKSSKDLGLYLNLLPLLGYLCIQGLKLFL